MKTTSPPRILLFLVAIVFPLYAGCGASATDAPVGGELEVDGRTAAVGETFKLKPEEKVSIRETQFTVQLKGVRRTWYVDGRGETADADLVLTLGGKERRQWIKAGEKATVGDFVVQVWGADPFGKTSADLIVTRR